MTTLAEIEAAAAKLPPEQKKSLLRFLAECLREPSAGSASRVSNGGRRGFPISRGRAPFTSLEVAEIDLETELSS